MHRRNLLKGALAAAIMMNTSITGKIKAGQDSEPVRPKVLKPGDTVGVIAPGTAVSNPDDQQKVKELMDFFGLKFRFGRNVLKGTGYKTRTVAERVDDIHEMFADKNINAVMCVRGGYGSGQLLDKIDYKLIAANPKIFLGYSDITAMHLAIGKFSNLVTFHGPVGLSSFTQLTVNYFRKAVFNSDPIGELINPSDKLSIHQLHPVRTIKSGKAAGKLTGGNLSLITSLMGTKYEIDTKDKILLLEDVDELPFRIDRMLTQLRLAGKLQQAKGIIFGECSGCSSNKPDAASTWDSSLGEVLDNILGDLNIPVFYGLAFGHTGDQFTIPMGVGAEMDSGNCKLTILEAGAVA